MHEYAAADKGYGKTIPVMHPESTLEVLMARYQEGDFGAATALIDRISPQLHRYFISQFASRSDADDLLQETWLRIHRVRHTYRAGEPVLPWFYAIARHVRVDHYRKAVRARTREESLQEANGATTGAGLGLAGKDEQLEMLLAPLPASQREVIEMLKVSGMSLEEVARATSSSVGSVKQKVHRAYKKMRERMGEIGLRKGRGGAA